MKFQIFLFLLSISFCAHSQLKQIAVGGMYSTNRFYTPIESEYPQFQSKPSQYNSKGILFQWNTRNILSFALNPSFEKSTRNYLEEKYLYDTVSDSYLHFLNERNYQIDRIMFPVLVRASFGKKVLYSPYVGLSYSFLLRSSSLTDKLYAYSNSDPIDLNNPFTINEYKAILSKTSELNFYTGIGLIIPIKSIFLVVLDFRLPMSSLSIPKKINRNEFMSFNKPTFSLSLAYQFNLKKNSTFEFSTYHFRFENTSE